MALFSENRRSFCGAFSTTIPIGPYPARKKEMKTLSMSVSRLILLMILELGKTLSEIRALTANGFIKFNIYKSFRANKCADLCISQVVNMEELRYVAN
ncbi:hypothetical protein [Escherichia coli]|uniref:hypothetical protein n=1 Tax=Escherichia coli TaxID=562 RepID=UPI003EC0943F